MVILILLATFGTTAIAVNQLWFDDAVRRLHQELSDKALLESAELYQQVYQDDLDLQELTDSAAS